MPYFRMPFAGQGDFATPDSVLSHCSGSLLPMFSTREANTLRLLCREFRDAVRDFPWDDIDTRINGSLLRWRECFPNARGANVSGVRKVPISDTDVLFHFKGIRRLVINGCKTITDAAFAHLKGIHTLHMVGCTQPSVTEAAFAHIAGVHELDVSVCSLSDSYFPHLKGVHTLVMAQCNQASITDAAFSHLAGIIKLDMSRCSQATITDGAFVHLTGVRELNMSMCSQETITDACFVHLKGIQTLNMSGCSQRTTNGFTGGKFRSTGSTT